MKIGIMTFHNSDNYGAVLQATALQYILKKLDNEVYIINYVCRNKINQYKILSLSKNKSIKENIRNILNVPFRIEKQKKIQEFIKKNYMLTKNTFYSSEEIIRANLNYDIYICGSDQIWNYENTGFDKAYFLDFECDSNKKMSYAASFGISSIEDKYKKEYKKMLDGIGYLSVREETGKEIINSINNRRSEVVLDPTLLLNKNDWSNYDKNVKKISDDYILLYSLHNSKEIFKLTKMLSKQTGYKVLQINTTGFKSVFSGFKNIIPNPSEFVSLINNSKYIVTDSFHGTAFSVNLNKNFFVFLGKSLKSHSRIKDLLKKCNLQNRIITDDLNYNLEDIDYTNVNKILELERKNSINFIVRSLIESRKYDENMIIND